jgi:hypothetical protein
MQQVEQELPDKVMAVEPVAQAPYQDVVAEVVLVLLEEMPGPAQPELVAQVVLEMLRQLQDHL